MFACSNAKSSRPADGDGGIGNTDDDSLWVADEDDVFSSDEESENEGETSDSVTEEEHPDSTEGALTPEGDGSGMGGDGEENESSDSFNEEEETGDTDTATGDEELSEEEDSNEEFPDIDVPPIICTPYEVEECPYSGPPATKDKGECKAATKTCSSDGTFWNQCVGEILPKPEICSNGLDDDCDGTVDEDEDLDGDGWGACSGDCCDNPSQCADPAKVNPGAVEVPGDGVDNDCNGQIDESPQPSCSSSAKFSGTGALDLLYAMDICKHSVSGSWGIVGTPTLTRANGSGSIDSSNRQVAVMTQFGTDAANMAIANGTMAVLSSGRARDANDPDPTTTVSYSYYTGNPPADFVAAHGGQLPTTKVGCPNGSGANDGVMLSVQLKVPTNAQSFSFNFRFFSQEYRQWTCTKYNDFFIAMLYTGASGIPADKNISFDSNGSYISVNSDQFFTVCNPKTGYTCPDGTAALNGTGYTPAEAGATKWLSTTAPVIPGETITLKFVIWDTSDQKYDSLVLLDNFKWSAQGTSGPSTFECWDLNQNGVCDVETEDNSGDGVCSERDC